MRAQRRHRFFQRSEGASEAILGAGCGRARLPPQRSGGPSEHAVRLVKRFWTTLPTACGKVLGLKLGRFWSTHCSRVWAPPSKHCDRLVSIFCSQGGGRDQDVCHANLLGEWPGLAAGLAEKPRLLRSGLMKIRPPPTTPQSNSNAAVAFRVPSEHVRLDVLAWANRLCRSCRACAPRAGVLARAHMRRLIIPQMGFHPARASLPPPPS